MMDADAFFYIIIFGFIGCLLIGPAFKFAGFLWNWVSSGLTHYGNPQPKVGPALAARARGEYDVALGLLNELTESYPENSIGYIAMMEIYSSDFKDYERVREVYGRGLLRVHDKDELKKLERAYKELTMDAPEKAKQ